VLQLGWAVLRDALCEVAGLDDSQHHQIYLKHSDSGETAAEMLQAREQPPCLSIEDVDALFQRLHAARGSLAKTGILAEALRKASSLEGRYLVKIITGDLRIGLKEGLVEEAVAQAFGKTSSEVRRANLLVGDIGETAELAAKDLLTSAKLTPLRPIKFMLASPEETAGDILERVKEWCVPTRDPKGVEAASETMPEANATPHKANAWIEDKYDGVRCQIHKVGQKVSLYSRDLKDITTTFMDLADKVRTESSDFVLDGEIVAMRDDSVLPFAELQKRLGRREGDLFMREEVPIRFVTFDLLWHAGETLLDRPLTERRELLERIVEVTDVLKIARITRASTTEEIESAFTAARERGNEGLMVKDPSSVYLPGRRGLSWLKLKKAFATLDCVVIGAEFGHGKRSKVLSDYTFAVRDEVSGELKTIGKAYSGLTDVEIAQLTLHFKSRAIRQQGRYFEVVPDTVLEIAFDKIQESERHNSGLAMRFPRIARIRSDKSPEEIDTLTTAQKLAGKH
jgi:DNA ligase-1